MEVNYEAEIARRHLDAWLEAEMAVAEGGQSYTIGTRTLTRANLSEIRDAIDYWRGKLARAENGGKIRLSRASICDF